MNLAHQLLNQVADPNLTHDERAQLRCRFARQLEDSGNYEAAREIMGELWLGVGHLPQLEGLNEQTAAEVLLRAGALTGWIGSCKQIEGAQETAKNLLSESLTLFEALGAIEKVAEAQVEIAYCYWRQGALNEARVWLREALGRLPSGGDDEVNDVRAVAFHRLAIVERSAKRFNDALRIYMEAAPLFERSGNHPLKGRFHIGFGTVLKNLGADERREDYIDRALIEYAAAGFHFEQAGHTRYQAYVENNLGYLFGIIKKFNDAHEHLDRAQALFTSMRDKTHIAQVDDTRARVLLEEGRIAEAEKLARAAVQGLKGSDQQILFAEALITHGIALSHLGRHEDARQSLQAAVEVAENAGDAETAGRAALTAIEELGEHLSSDDLSQLYEHATELLDDSRDLGTLLRLTSCARRVLFLAGVSPSTTTWKGFSLKDALRRYEARIIELALREAGGIVSRAAQLLGLKSHNSLIKILNTRHRHLLSKRKPIKPRKRSLMFIHHAATDMWPLAILHVEDTMMVADAVKETLELEGWSVETLMDGTAALDALRSGTHYDVLIFDNELPGISGLELVSQARQLAHRQHTPIIMLSASPVEAEARRAGANVFLRKPEDITAITETIARLLAHRLKQMCKEQ